MTKKKSPRKDKPKKSRPRAARARKRKAEAGMLSSPRALPAGALVLTVALLALLAAFHSARERLAPPVHKPFSQASLSDSNLGH